MSVNPSVQTFGIQTHHIHQFGFGAHVSNHYAMIPSNSETLEKGLSQNSEKLSIELITIHSHADGVELAPLNFCLGQEEIP